jgi:hypothetical protein
MNRLARLGRRDPVSRALRRRPGSTRRDRILFRTLTPLGLGLFAVGAIGAKTGAYMIPFDPHHMITEIVGLAMAFTGLTRWK